MTAPQPDVGGQLPDQLLTITDLAKMLDVNTRHIRRLVFEDRIPYIKWGHLIRFDPREIKAWLELHRRGQRVATFAQTSGYGAS